MKTRRAFETTDFDFIRKRARPLSNRERQMAHLQSPFNKKVVARRYGGGHFVHEEVRMDMTGNLSRFGLRPNHVTPEYVEALTAIPRGFQRM